MESGGASDAYWFIWADVDLDVLSLSAIEERDSEKSHMEKRMDPFGSVWHAKSHPPIRISSRSIYAPNVLGLS